MKYIILIVFIIPLFVKSQNVKKIELINADMIDYDEARYGKNVRRMVGNVTLKHENAILTCDSAFYNTEQNDVQMYGEVNINFSDTIQITSNSASDTKVVLIGRGYTIAPANSGKIYASSGLGKTY
ncbi:MAG TPA: OstA-like protein, partial [Bacteroidales bacterium]|nr:OstA-like protein [Bacteroidales bacterium]